MLTALLSGLRCVVPERDAAILLVLSQQPQLMTQANLAVVMNNLHKKHVASTQITSPLAQQSDTPSFVLNMTVAETHMLGHVTSGKLGPHMHRTDL